VTDVYKNVSFIKNFHITYDVLISKTNDSNAEEETDNNQNNNTYDNVIGSNIPIVNDGQNNIIGPNESKKSRNQLLLEEKEEFIQFRDSMSQEIVDSLFNKLDPIGIIKLSIDLTSHLLLKDSLEADERAIIENCLCLITCLICKQPYLLESLLYSNRSEDFIDSDLNKLKAKDSSDFSSFIMTGLNYGVFIIRKQFNNMFLVIVRESETQKTQKYLLKIMLQNI